MEDKNKRTKSFKLSLDDTAIVIKKDGNVEIICAKKVGNENITESEELALAFTLILNNSELYDAVMENYEFKLNELEQNKDKDKKIEDKFIPFIRTNYGNYGFDNLN